MFGSRSIETVTTSRTPRRHSRLGLAIRGLLVSSALAGGLSACSSGSSKATHSSNPGTSAPAPENTGSSSTTTVKTTGEISLKTGLCDIKTITALAAQALGNTVSGITCSPNIVYTGALGEAVFTNNGTSGPLAPSLEIIIEPDDGNFANLVSEAKSHQFPTSTIEAIPNINGLPAMWVGDSSLLDTLIAPDWDLAVLLPGHGSVSLATQVVEETESLALQS